MARDINLFGADGSVDVLSVIAGMLVVLVPLMLIAYITFVRRTRSATGNS